MEPVIDLDRDQLVVVSVGTDHHPFDRLIRWVDDYRHRRPSVRFVVQRGTSRFPLAGVESPELIPHDELRRLFARATAIVAHGGPSTVMDARSMGRLPIVVPRRPELGEHIDGHQLRFADHLVEQHLARVALVQSEFIALLDDAIDNSSAYRLAGGTRPMPAGVMRLAARLDELLDTPPSCRLRPGPTPSQRPRPRRRRQRARAGEAPMTSVSVVIATRDRPDLLRRAIDAVVNQDHPGDIEVVVVFDHSDPDRSLERSSARRRVLVTSNDRRPGLAGARNAGMAKASNPWIAFCDDDDEWLAGKLAAQFDALAADPSARWATTGVFIHYDGTDTPRVPDAEKLTFGGFLEDRMTDVHPSATLVAADLAAEIGDVDEDIPGGYGEDYDWFLRASRLSPVAVAAVPLVRVHWHGQSYFFERWKIIDQALEYLVEKYPEFADHPRGLARIRGQQAVAQAAMGDRRRAVSTAWTAVRLNPTERRAPVAMAVAAGVPAAAVLRAAHRLGRGI